MSGKSRGDKSRALPKSQKLLRKLIDNYVSNTDKLLLKYMHLNGAEIKSIVQRCPRIQHADFSHNNITGADFKDILTLLTIERHTSLSVAFRNNKLGWESNLFEGVKVEKNSDQHWKWLTYLDMSHCDLSRNNVKELIAYLKKNAPYLRELNLTGNKLGDNVSDLSKDTSFDLVTFDEETESTDSSDSKTKDGDASEVNDTGSDGNNGEGERQDPVDAYWFSETDTFRYKSELNAMGFRILHITSSIKESTEAKTDTSLSLDRANYKDFTERKLKERIKKFLEEEYVTSGSEETMPEVRYTTFSSFNDLLQFASKANTKAKKRHSDVFLVEFVGALLVPANDLRHKKRSDEFKQLKICLEKKDDDDGHAKGYEATAGGEKIEISNLENFTKQIKLWNESGASISLQLPSKEGYNCGLESKPVGAFWIGDDDKKKEIEKEEVEVYDETFNWNDDQLLKDFIEDTWESRFGVEKQCLQWVELQVFDDLIEWIKYKSVLPLNGKYELVFLVDGAKNALIIPSKETLERFIAGTDGIDDDDDRSVKNEEAFEKVAPNDPVLKAENHTFPHQRYIGDSIVKKIKKGLEKKNKTLSDFKRFDYCVVVPCFVTLERQTVVRLRGMGLMQEVDKEKPGIHVTMSSTENMESLKNRLQEGIKPEDSDTLHVVVIDECHYSPTAGTLGQILANPEFSDAVNMVFILVSATPMNCLTNSSQVYPHNVIDWGYEDDPCYYGIDHYVDSIAWRIAGSYRMLTFSNTQTQENRNCVLREDLKFPYFQIEGVYKYLKTEIEDLFKDRQERTVRIGANKLVIGPCEGKGKNDIDNQTIILPRNWVCDQAGYWGENFHLWNPEKNMHGCVPTQHQAIRSDTWFDKLCGGTKSLLRIKKKKSKSSKEDRKESAAKNEQEYRLFMLIADYLFSMTYLFMYHFSKTDKNQELSWESVTSQYKSLCEGLQTEAKEFFTSGDDKSLLLSPLFEHYIKQAKKQYDTIGKGLDPIQQKINDRKERNSAAKEVWFYTETDRLIDDWFSNLENNEEKGNMVIMRVYLNMHNNAISTILNKALALLEDKVYGSDRSENEELKLPCAVSDTGRDALKASKLSKWMREKLISKSSTYQSLLDLPVLVVLTERGRMGDTFPHSVCAFDFRLRQSGSYTTLVQELGRLCRYPEIEKEKIPSVDEPTLQEGFDTHGKRIRIKWMNEKQEGVIQDVLSLLQFREVWKRASKESREAYWFTHRLPVAIVKNDVYKLVGSALEYRWQNVVMPAHRPGLTYQEGQMEYKYTQNCKPGHVPSKVPAWSAIDCIPIRKPLRCFDPYIADKSGTQKRKGEERKVDAENNDWHSVEAYQRRNVTEKHFDYKKHDKDDLRIVLKAKCQVGKTGAFLYALCQLRNEIEGKGEELLAEEGLLPKVPTLNYFDNKIKTLKVDEKQDSDLQMVQIPTGIVKENCPKLFDIENGDNEDMKPLRFNLNFRHGFVRAVLRVSVPEKHLDKFKITSKSFDGESCLFVITNGNPHHFYDYRNVISEERLVILIVDSYCFDKYTMSAVANHHIILEVAPMLRVKDEEGWMMYPMETSDRYKFQFSYSFAKQNELESFFIMSDNAVACYDTRTGDGSLVKLEQVLGDLESTVHESILGVETNKSASRDCLKYSLVCVGKRSGAVNFLNSSNDGAIEFCTHWEQYQLDAKPVPEQTIKALTNLILRYRKPYLDGYEDELPYRFYASSTGEATNSSPDEEQETSRLIGIFDCGIKDYLYSLLHLKDVLDHFGEEGRDRFDMFCLTMESENSLKLKKGLAAFSIDGIHRHGNHKLRIVQSWECENDSNKTTFLLSVSDDAGKADDSYPNSSANGDRSPGDSAQSSSAAEDQSDIRGNKRTRGDSTSSLEPKIKRQDASER